MKRIVHASDFHFSGPYFSENLWKEFCAHVRHLNPDIFLITGDITDEGYPHEYALAKQYLDSLEGEKLVLPGNHDARNVGYEVFEEIFGPRWNIWKSDGICILCGDSSEPDIDDGHIGRENYALMEKTLDCSDFTMFAIHHHLIPIPGTGRERNIPVDAGDVLKIITSTRTNLVLSGHKHVGWSWKLESTVFLVAGTATTTRVKSKTQPSFFCIDIDSVAFDCRVQKVDLFTEDIMDPNGRKPFMKLTKV